jgi:hypothetical protein
MVVLSWEGGGGGGTNDIKKALYSLFFLLYGACQLKNKRWKQILFASACGASP